MDVKAVAARLISPFAAGRSQQAGSNGFAGLASQYAATKAGIAPGRPAGEFTPIYRSVARYVEREQFEERDTVETKAVFEERAVMEERETTASRDIVEERTVYETRPVYETRAVFENQAIMQATVTGTRSLSTFDKAGQAGLLSGSKFTVQVGDGAVATITFADDKKITLTVNGSTQTFKFDNRDGEFRDGLTDALNSITGLTASFNSAGKLELATTDGQSLSLGRVGLGTALTQLGLASGTTEARVTGSRRVQTGTEQVQVGTTQVATGTAWVVIGTEQYVTGTQMVQVGTAQVKVGEAQVVTGRETVSLGMSKVLDGHDRRLIGLERGDFRDPGALGGTLSLKVGSGLPSGYVELLFGVLSPPGRDDAPAERPDGRAAYRAVEEDKRSPAEEEDAVQPAVKAGHGTRQAWLSENINAPLGQGAE